MASLTEKMSQNIELQRQNSNLPPNLCWRIAIAIHNEKVYFGISHDLSEVAFIAKIEQGNGVDDTIQSVRVRFREMQCFIYDLLAADQTSNPRLLFDHLGTCYAIEGCLLIEVFFSTSNQLISCLENMHQLKKLFQSSFSKFAYPFQQIEISTTLVLFSNLAWKLHLVTKETAERAFSLLYPISPTIPILQINDPETYVSISEAYTKLLEMFPNFYGATVGKPVHFYREHYEDQPNLEVHVNSFENIRAPENNQDPDAEVKYSNSVEGEDLLGTDEMLDIAKKVSITIAPNLGRALGLTETEINNITSRMDRDPEVKVFDILEKATRKNIGTRKHIAAALLQIQQFELAKEIDSTIKIPKLKLPPFVHYSQVPLVIHGSLKLFDREIAKEYIKQQSAISFWHNLHEKIAPIVKSCLNTYNIPIGTSLISSFQTTISLHSLHQAQQLAIDIENSKFVTVLEKKLIVIGYENKLAVSFQIYQEEVTPENCTTLYMKALLVQYQHIPLDDHGTTLTGSPAAQAPLLTKSSSKVHKSSEIQLSQVVVGSASVFVPKVSKKAQKLKSSVILDNIEVQFDDKNELYFFIRKKHPKAIELINDGYTISEPDDNGYFPIHHAAQYGNDEAVKTMLKRGIEVDMQTKHYKLTSLHVAANVGQSVVVETLVMAGANIEALTFNGLTPIRLATNTNHVEVMKILLKKGATPNTCDYEGNTPLHVAVDQGNNKIIELLLEYNASVFIKNKDGKTAFQLAIILKKHTAIKQFLQKYPILAKPAKYMGNPPLLECCINGGDIKTAQVMLDHGADPNAINPQQEGSPLHAACELDHLDLIELLIKHGADPTMCFPTIATPLHHAIWMNKINAVKKLIELKVNPNMLSMQKISPLVKAIICEKFEIALFLIESGGADVNQMSRPKPDITYPIHIAVIKKSQKILESIVDHDGAIDQPDHDGNTALHLAAFHHENNMIEFLCQRGANLNIKNIKGTTPLIAAIKTKNIDGSFLLLSYEPDINIIDYERNNALMYAFFEKMKSVADFLLNLGASFDELNFSGFTAFHAGCEYGDVSQVSLMLSINPNILAFLNETSGSTTCPIHVALRNPPVLKFLLEKGEDPDKIVVNNEVQIPILYEAISNGYWESLQILLDYKADTNIKILYGTALHVAVGSKFASDETLSLLLKAGAKMVQGPDNVTPLFIAAEKNKLSKAKILLEHGAKVEMSKESNWFNSLHVAVFRNHIAMIKLLLKYTKDIDMKTKNEGFTPLFVAIIQKSEKIDEIFDILVENNANIDTQDINGNTPLIYVIQDNNLSVANKLLELGANVNTANKKGLTPLIAAMLYMSELADTLIDKGANVNAQMNDGLSCLHIAVIQQNNSLLMKLINKGVSLKFTATRPNALSNPFHHALKYENVSAVKIFLSNGATIEDAEKLLEQTHNNMLEPTTNKIFASLENILSDARCNNMNLKNEPIKTIKNEAVHLVIVY